MTTSALSADRRRAGGLTLTELLLVVLILALAATLALPALGRVHRATWEAPGYQLMSVLRQARWAAMTSGQNWTVVLEPVSQGVRVTAEGPRAAAAAAPGARGQSEAAPTAPAWGEPVVLPLPRAALADGQTRRIEFTPLGVERDHRLPLHRTGRRETRIEVRRPSGLVWLTCEDVTTPADDRLPAARSYWERHLRNAR